MADGGLRPGDRLPAENALAANYGVSRVTVRTALRLLSQEGLVESQPGRGSFVSSPVGERSSELLSFTELGRRRGLAASARVLTARSHPAGVEDADTLGVAPGSALFELERLRLLDGIAVSVDHSLVPLGLAPDLPRHDFRTTSLYAVLEEAGAGPQRADYAVQAVAADDRQAGLLDVPVGAPLLHTRTLSHTSSGTAVELGVMSYRGDRYRFRATLSRGGTTR